MTRALNIAAGAGMVLLIALSAPVYIEKAARIAASHSPECPTSRC